MDLSKKILVVEDDNAISQILLDTLTKEGYVALQARDGIEGFKAVVESQPDLILLDILMPNMDGMTMLKKIREKESSKKIPVIILTNLETLDSLNKALGHGAYDYLVKSDWKLEDVMKKVKQRLKDG